MDNLMQQLVDARAKAVSRENDRRARVLLGKWASEEEPVLWLGPDGMVQGVGTRAQMLVGLD